MPMLSTLRACLTDVTGYLLESRKVPLTCHAKVRLLPWTCLPLAPSTPPRHATNVHICSWRRPGPRPCGHLQEHAGAREGAHRRSGSPCGRWGAAAAAGWPAQPGTRGVHRLLGTYRARSRRQPASSEHRSPACMLCSGGHLRVLGDAHPCRQEAGPHPQDAREGKAAPPPAPPAALARTTLHALRTAGKDYSLPKATASLESLHRPQDGSQRWVASRCAASACPPAGVAAGGGGAAEACALRGHQPLQVCLPQPTQVWLATGLYWLAVAHAVASLVQHPLPNMQHTDALPVWGCGLQARHPSQQVHLCGVMG